MLPFWNKVYLSVNDHSSTVIRMLSKKNYSRCALKKGLGALLEGGVRVYKKTEKLLLKLPKTEKLQETSIKTEN